jgi:hypothetical protein
MSELTENSTWSKFSGAALADIYSRLRREQVDMVRGLDPNEPLRARLALAVLTAAELGSADPISLEATARALLRVNFNCSPPAS